MKLLNLTLDNFKGMKHFELDPQGSSMDIFGENATGKTTLADAYFWLLFGKDSENKVDFGILPEDEYGDIIEGLDATVSGSFSDKKGQQFSLKRVYHQVFSRKNGEAERELKNNTTDFFINDVPKPKKDYTAFVDALCDEKTFTLLTDPDMFPGKLKWDERRDTLIRQFAPDVDDREIINAHEDLKPLLQYIGYKAVDEYSEITKAQRRKINEELAGIPGRIDEAEKAKPFDVPTASDGPELVRLGKSKFQLESALQKIRNGESAAAIRRKIGDLQADLSTARAEYIRVTTSGNTGTRIESSELRTRIGQLQNDISRRQFETKSTEEMISGLAKEIEELRADCITTFGQTFDPTQGCCPTCGREYPAEKIDELQAAFNEQKAAKLGNLEAKGKQLAGIKSGLESSLEENRLQLQADQQSLKDAETRLDKLTKSFVAPPAFETTTKYRQLQDQISAAERDLSAVDSVAATQTEKLTAQLVDVSGQIDAIKQRMTAKAIVEQQDKRIAELKKLESELSQLLATYDNGLLLAEKFVQTKAQDIEQKINGAFRLVRWKLFKKQQNGGINACCEATVKGKKYNRNLNSAAKLNAGLDIINTLGRAAGVSVPVWIDNAESVTSYLPIDAQVIRLHVSARDKQLRAEVRG